MTTILFSIPLDGGGVNLRELSWPVVPRVGEDVYLFHRDSSGSEGRRKLRVAEVGYVENVEQRTALEAYAVPAPGCVVRVVLTDREPVVLDSAKMQWGTGAGPDVGAPPLVAQPAYCTGCGAAMFAGSGSLCPDCFEVNELAWPTRAP